jgi:uncharacterized protein (DUF433 family)
MSLPVVLIPHPHVRADANIMNGSPYVAGSRVPVRRIYSFYLGGTSFERILKRYPQLGAAKVLDALAFALDNEDVVKADIEREQVNINRATRGAVVPKS